MGPAGDRDRVPALGSALGEQEVPGTVYLVEVRPFREVQATPLPDRVGRLQQPAGLDIEPSLEDSRIITAS